MPDEGMPIAYTVLETNVPVYAVDGQEIGTVAKVLAAPELDIFHGIVMRSQSGIHSIPADQVASLHERGVDLRIDAAAAEALPPPAAERATTGEVAKEPSSWTRFVGQMFPFDKH